MIFGCKDIIIYLYKQNIYLIICLYKCFFVPLHQKKFLKHK